MVYMMERYQVQHTALLPLVTFRYSTFDTTVRAENGAAIMYDTRRDRGGRDDCSGVTVMYNGIIYIYYLCTGMYHIDYVRI